MRKIAAFAFAALLFGCDTVPKNINAGLRSFVGKDVHKVFAALGYPATQRTIAGDIIYTWSTNSNVPIDLPSVTTTTGNVNGAPFSATTMGTETTELQYRCAIQVITDSTNVVKTFQWEGNYGGCKRYADALDQ